MNKRVICLTGGIGAGKSAVSDYLGELGADVIDADLIGKAMTEPGSPILESIFLAFGQGLRREDGSLDRKGLARLVFSDRRLLRRLNGLTHPSIAGEIRKRISESAAEVVCVVAPLLIEAGQEDLGDVIWVVEAPLAERVARVMKRDGAGRRDILLRMRAQAPPWKLKKSADVVIDNGSSPEAARSQVLAAWRSLLAEIKER